MVLANLLSRGGPVMYVLLVLSVWALAIVLLKGIQLARLRLRSTAFVTTAVARLEDGDETAATTALAGEDHPIARVLAASLSVATDSSVDPEAARAEVSRVGSGELRKLESWLRGLSAIGHLSPLLGLLGTVIGMIEAFRQIEGAGRVVDPALLSGGIWQALLTTAFGLTIAIPSMAAFHLFEGEVDRHAAAMKDAAQRVLLAFGKLAADEAELEPAASRDRDYAV